MPFMAVEHEAHAYFLHKKGSVTESILIKLLLEVKRHRS